MEKSKENISKHILNNIPYCNILLSLVEKPSNSGELEKVLNKPQSVIYRQLKKLEEENYVLDSKRFSGKKEYEINFEKIATEFLIYIEYQYLKKSIKTENLGEDIFIKHPYYVNFNKNIYLVKLLSSLFKLNINNNITIIEIFDILVDIVKDFSFEDILIPKDNRISEIELEVGYKRDDKNFEVFYEFINDFNNLIISKNIRHIRALLEEEVIDYLKENNPITKQELNERKEVSKDEMEKRKAIGEDIGNKLKDILQKHIDEKSRSDK